MLGGMDRAGRRRADSMGPSVLARAVTTTRESRLSRYPVQATLQPRGRRGGGPFERTGRAAPAFELREHCLDLPQRLDGLEASRGFGVPAADVDRHTMKPWQPLLQRSKAAVGDHRLHRRESPREPVRRLVRRRDEVATTGSNQGSCRASTIDSAPFGTVTGRGDWLQPSEVQPGHQTLPRPLAAIAGSRGQ